VVYLGVPLEEFARPRSPEEIASARADLGVPEGALAIGTITRLMPFKGNTYLVQAFKSIFERVPHARGFIIGEGELGAALHAEAKALGILDRLTFSGFKRDVAAALSALDIAVFPSLIEGTPLTAFEALAMGKPIVSTDADGLKDILTADRDAVIVPRENAPALADAIVALADDPARRAALGAEARLTGQRYDIRAFVEKMERLYVLLHEAKGRHGRSAVLREDLSFLR
jgi:glycosyltransferase involved in cell wall biosynthesis